MTIFSTPEQRSTTSLKTERALGDALEKFMRALEQAWNVGDHRAAHELTAAIVSRFAIARAAHRDREGKNPL